MLQCSGATAGYARRLTGRPRLRREPYRAGRCAGLTATANAKRGRRKRAKRAPCKQPAKPCAPRKGARSAPAPSEGDSHATENSTSGAAVARLRQRQCVRSSKVEVEPCHI